MNFIMSDIILITSVINTGTMPWSYSKDRSVFSLEERFLQTLKTIESIRTYFPSAKIFLVECSDLKQEFAETIREKVEYFVNVYENQEIRDSCINTYKKGYGEGMKTKFAIEFLFQHQIPFRRLFKISGRYLLNERFNETLFSYDSFTFKKRIDKQYPHVLSHFTLLYSVPFPLIQHFYSALCWTIDFYRNNEPIGFEELLPTVCNPKVLLSTLGCTGHCAVDNEFVDE